MKRVRRGGKPAITGLGMALAMALAGCSAPPYTYVANTTAHAYFKVPRGWTQISTAALVKAATGGAGGGAWTVGFDASRSPSAQHVLRSVPGQPFAYATVGPLSPAGTDMLSYDALRDLILPVTDAARQNAAQQGFPLTGFKLLSSRDLMLGQGIHGVAEAYDYTYPGQQVVTFDQVALTNADDTEVYLLLVHCTARCYSDHKAQISTVMNSFTVRSP
ncbi:MAG: hypothetical protein ACRDNZ_13175 [Streptosporangiaceae bacterium]